MSMDPTWLPAWELREQLRRRELSPVEVVRNFLERIERLDAAVHAYLTVDAEGALAQAKRAEQAILAGGPLGPLHGIPVSIKDLLWTRGLRTTNGSRLFEDFVPGEDATTVARIRAAGGIVLGKTNTPEFGALSRTANLVGEETLNPWDPSRIPGASSGGAGAAVAAGLGPLAIGSDGGGSIRLPAAYNGVFGLFPSPGRVSNHHSVGGRQWSSGPITRDVRDAALLLEVIAGFDPLDPNSMREPAPRFTDALEGGVEGWRLAWSPDLGRLPVGDGRVVEAIRRTAARLEELGARIEEPDMAFGDLWPAYLGAGEYEGEWMEPLRRDPAAREQLSPPLAVFYGVDAGRGERELEDARRSLAAFEAKLAALFERYDLLLWPASALVAPKVPDGWEQPYPVPEYGERFGVPYLFPVNLARLCAASLPAGFVDGLPVGLHLVAPRGEECRVLRGAAALERVVPWHERRPPLALSG